jgi:flavodoxin
MKVLVVYDSLYGNTEQIAKAIGGAIRGEVRVLRVAEANPAEAGSFDLFIVGSPTQGGRATKSVQDFLSKIPPDSLRNVSVTSFDTRHKNMLTRPFGYAAGRIADSLKSKGGALTVPPEGFVVKGTRGPLGDGELERAADWAKGVLATKK